MLILYIRRNILQWTKVGKLEESLKAWRGYMMREKEERMERKKEERRESIGA